jgi:hypothetical protein
MKLHGPIGSALPAVLATASALLLLVMLPAGGAPTRSSGAPPALKLVAGDVVAAVESPVRVVSRPNPKPNPAATPAAAATATVQVAHPAPVHRHAQHRIRASRPRIVASRPVTKQAAPTPISTIVEHGNGKAKARGHMRRTDPQAVSPSEALHAAKVNGAAHAKAQGRPADVPHGPPAVPPGLAKKDDASEHGASADRGGGK